MLLKVYSSKENAKQDNFQYLSSCHRHQHHGHQEVPDEEEDGEDDLTDPVGLTDDQTDLRYLTRVHIVIGHIASPGQCQVGGCPGEDVLDGRHVEDDHEQGQHQTDDEGGVDLENGLAVKPQHVEKFWMDKQSVAQSVGVNT